MFTLGDARGIMPPVKKYYDFFGGADIETQFQKDLKFGKENEELLAGIIEGKESIEVKTERDIWVKSGNFVLELYRITPGGKRELSGLSISRSQHWIQSFSYEGMNVGFVSFPTKLLRDFTTYIMKKKYVSELTPMGDDYRTYGILVPLFQFWTWWREFLLKKSSKNKAVKILPRPESF